MIVLKFVFVKEGKSPYMFAYIYRSTGKGITEYTPNYYHCLPSELRTINVTNIWERLDFPLFICIVWLVAISTTTFDSVVVSTQVELPTHHP